MRFSHIQLFNQSLRSFNDLQAGNIKIQEQISSGRKVLLPSDDPIASARIQQLQDELAQIGQFKQNISTIELRLSAQEVQIGSAENIVIRLRELAIRAGNASTTQQDRQAIATEVEQMRDELLSLANSRDGSGKYIFSGFQSDNPPYQKDPTDKVQYVGDEGARSLRISASTSLSMTTKAREIFTDVPSLGNTFAVTADPANTSLPPAKIEPLGIVNQTTFDATFASYPDDYIVEFDDPPTSFNVTRRSDGGVENLAIPYTSGDPITVNGRQFAVTGVPAAGDRFVVESRSTTSVFESIDTLIEGLDSLGDTGPESIELSNLVGEALQSFDNSLNQMLRARTSIGARLNVLENTENIHLDVELISQRTLSEIRDLNYEEAVTRLAQQSFVLEAAQQSFSRIANLSLFNFLR